MAARAIEQGVPLPEFLKHARHAGGVVLEARDLAKSFGGIKAVTDASVAVRDRTLHALIGPNGAGKTTVFNLITGMFAPDHGSVVLAGRVDRRRCRRTGSPRPDSAARSRSPTCFPRVSIAENLRLAVQARDASHFDGWTDAQRNERVTRAHGGADPLPRAVGHRAAPKRDRCRTAASACSTWGWRSPARRACCCSTSRSPASPPRSASASAA